MNKIYKKIDRKQIKKLIIQHLKKTNNCSTIEEMFTAIKDIINDLDKNVFLEELNNLEKKREILYTLSLNNREDCDIEKDDHYHCYFICDNCGMVKDIFIKQGAISMLKDHAQRLINSYAKINEVNLSFQGICHECRKK